MLSGSGVVVVTFKPRSFEVDFHRGVCQRWHWVWAPRSLEGLDMVLKGLMVQGLGCRADRVQKVEGLRFRLRNGLQVLGSVRGFLGIR